MGKTAMILATWFGSGILPVAPGTFGSLAGLPLVVILSYLGDLYTGIALLALIPLAVWSSRLCEILLKRRDPKEVVIDEVTGFLLSIYLIPFSCVSIFLGFLFFRIFDILKPFPIGWADRKIKGGKGIVTDDLLAGIYANICIRFFLMIFNHFH
ncbi:MAG: phosphatidylglycerophosphatase A [Deltaproteobacteria bacterium]|nr:phosphatidylglycerophosphatase A [Deltaproteobacteria bacterium]